MSFLPHLLSTIDYIKQETPSFPPHAPVTTGTTDPVCYKLELFTGRKGAGSWRSHEGGGQDAAGQPLRQVSRDKRVQADQQSSASGGFRQRRPGPDVKDPTERVACCRRRTRLIYYVVGGGNLAVCSSRLTKRCGGRLSSKSEQGGEDAVALRLGRGGALKGALSGVLEMPRGRLDKVRASLFCSLLLHEVCL